MSPNPSRTPWMIGKHLTSHIYTREGCIVAFTASPELASLIVAAVNEKAERDARAAEPVSDFNRITEVPNA